jgi:hypothetical protein
MFKESSAKNCKDYIKAIPDGRKEIIEFLDDLIQKTVPKLERYFATNMLGYGKFQYLDSKKKPNDWPIISLANQKNYVSLYVCAVEGGQYIADLYKDELGKVSVGKSCIRFKKLEDLHIPTLKKVLKVAAKKPGLLGAKIG